MSSILIPVSSLQDGTSLDAKERVCTVTYPDNIPTLNGHLRTEMRLQNLWHRATYIVVKYQGAQSKNSSDKLERKDRQFIVQKRSQLKDFCPGLFDPAPGGVVGFGESYLENASREIKEEMGIDVSDNNPFKNRIDRMFEFSYQDEIVRVFGECFEVKYTGLLDELRLQEAEVEKVFIMTASEIKEVMDTKPEQFLPDALHAMKLYFEYTAE
jgi:8-oxo-dGTP pyrophosphatase MutT (NUDIX family)